VTRPRRWSLALLALLAAAAAPAPAAAQATHSMGVVTSLSGEATVARTPTPQPLPLRFKDDIFARDRISTAAKSILRVLLGGKSLVTVRELSVLSVIDEADRATVDVNTGKIAMGVVRQRMRPGEAVNIRTHNVIVAVRGTVVVVDSAPAQRRTSIYALRDAVDVFLRNIAGAPPIQLVAPQMLTVIDNTPGPITALGADDIRDLILDLQIQERAGLPPDAQAGAGPKDRAAAELEAQGLAGKGSNPPCTSIFEPCASERGFTPPPVIPPVQPAPPKGKSGGCSTSC
jgi:hypothetical protein